MTEYKFRLTPMFRQKLTTKTVMKRLTIGLLIIFAFGLYNAYSDGMEYVTHALLMLVTALVAGIGTECVYALVTKKNVKEFLSTSFPWVTCLIIVEIVPSDTSLYAIFVSTVLAIFFGKLAFGGFGQNTFNPAAVGRCICATSFVSKASVDLISSATPCTRMATVNWLMTPSSFQSFLNEFGGLGNLVFGHYHGAIGETSALLLLIILIVFLVRGVVDYRVPMTYLGTCFIIALIIGLTHGLGITYAIAFVCTGGLMYGAVIMLTDPVTSPVSVPGRMVFAAVAALVTCLIRFFGKMPEGVCYSILIANMLSPLIDKIFSCKQTVNYKKNAIIVVCTIVGVIAIVTIGSTSLSATYYVPTNTVEDGQRAGIDYKTVETPAAKENGVIASDDWASAYPEIVESYHMTGDNEYTVSYLEEDPYLVNLYEGYGFAKDYNSARGHEYVLEDVAETARPHALANCLTCKTADFTALVNNMGTDAYSLSFEDVYSSMSENVGCYTCHSNMQGNEGQLQVSHDYTLSALGDNVDTIDADTLVCGQCHTEYYFKSDTKATYVPYSSIETMNPDDELAYYNEIDFADWTQESTGAKLLKVQHPEMETYLNNSVHYLAGLSCADCHMATAYTDDGEAYVSHNIESPLNNETLLESCTRCHGDEDMVEKVTTLQSEITARETEVGNKLSDLKDKLVEANKSGDYTDDELDAIRKLYRNAQWYFDYDYVENSEGVHNSTVARYCLDTSESIIDEAMELFK